MMRLPLTLVTYSAVDVIEAQCVPTRGSSAEAAFFYIDVALTAGFTLELV